MIITMIIMMGLLGQCAYTQPTHNQQPHTAVYIHTESYTTNEEEPGRVVSSDTLNGKRGSRGLGVFCGTGPQIVKQGDAEGGGENGIDGNGDVIIAFPNGGGAGGGDGSVSCGNTDDGGYNSSSDGYETDDRAIREDDKLLPTLVEFGIGGGGGLREEDECAADFEVCSVSIRVKKDCGNVVAVLYSFLPIVIVPVIICCALLGIGNVMAEGFLLCLMACAGLFSAFLKSIFKQRRPLGSAAGSHGMPSAHSAITVSAVLWLLLEFSVVNGIFADFDPSRKIFLISVLLLLFAPVPWARWRLKDHSFAQVVAGSAVGLIIGAIAFALRINIPLQM
eukprot:GHVQ01002025.1.p1 GENE.GHVQ01002025.1~~GHVQ01002025.1.p1  ORF type:complete len:335 (+),score=65.61 GHVQ01002025.1:67-1071(+)